MSKFGKCVSVVRQHLVFSYPHDGLNANCRGNLARRKDIHNSRKRLGVAGTSNLKDVDSVEVWLASHPEWIVGHKPFGVPGTSPLRSIGKDDFFLALASPQQREWLQKFSKAFLIDSTHGEFQLYRIQG